MSRGQEYTPTPEKRLPPITKDEVEMAGLDYAKWRRERHNRGKYGSWAGELWDATVKKYNTAMADWLEPLIVQYDLETHEREILRAALAVTYDLLRRKGVLRIMDQGFLSFSDVAKALPKADIKVPEISETYAILVRDRARIGKVAMENEQISEWVTEEIWKLLPDVLDMDLTAFNSNTVGNYKSLVEWGAHVMYGCLRQQLEQRQS